MTTYLWIFCYGWVPNQELLDRRYKGVGSCVYLDLSWGDVGLVGDCDTSMVLDMQRVDIAIVIRLESDDKPLAKRNLDRFGSLSWVSDDLEVEFGLANAGIKGLLNSVDETDGALWRAEDEDLRGYVVFGLQIMGDKVEVDLGCPWLAPETYLRHGIRRDVPDCNQRRSS